MKNIDVEIIKREKVIHPVNVSSRLLTKSFWSGGLHKILANIDLVFGRKISIKILSVFLQKLCL